MPFIFLMTLGHAHATLYVPRLPARTLNAVCETLLSGGSRGGASKAIATFREHRLRKLNQAVVKPRLSSTLSIDEGSSAAKRRKLAAHLRAVELWGQLPDESRNLRLAGQVYTGEHEIELYFRSLASIRSEVTEYLLGKPNRSLNLTSSMVYLTATLFTVSESFLLTDIQSIYPVAIFALAALAHGEMTYSLQRARIERDRRRDAFDRNLVERVNESRAGWLFESQTYGILESVAEVAFNHGIYLRDSALADQQTDSSLRLMFTIFNFLERRFGDPGEMQRTFVTVDRLLTYDEDAQPRLTVVLRTSLRNPARLIFAAKTPAEAPGAGIPTPVAR